MKVVEWHGRRAPKVKNGVLVKGYQVVWDLTLQCGHIVRMVTSKGTRPPAGSKCPVCEGEKE